MKKSDLIKITTEMDREMGMDPAPPVEGKIADLRKWLMTTLPYVQSDDEFDKEILDSMPLDKLSELIETQLEDDSLVDQIIDELNQGAEADEQFTIEQYKTDAMTGASYLGVIIDDDPGETVDEQPPPETEPEPVPESESEPKPKKDEKKTKEKKAKKKETKAPEKAPEKKESTELTKSNLYRALDIVTPGLDKTGYIDQSTSFIFKDGFVITFNNEISVKHPIFGLKTEGAVKADELYKLLSKIKSEDITISEGDKELLVTSGNTQAGIRMDHKILLPLDAIEDEGEWHDLPEDFPYYLNYAMSSCGNDHKLESVLTNVNITREGHVIGSDGRKIMNCNLGVEMPVDDFLISSNAAKHVSEMGPNHISLGNNWVHFKSDNGTEMSCRVLNAKYPDVKRITVEGISVELPENMKDILARTSIFSKRSSNYEESIEVTLEKNKLIVYAESEDGSWIKETEKTNYDDQPITFSIAPYLFKDIMKETNEFVLGKNALKFEGSGWEYITQLKAVK